MRTKEELKKVVRESTSIAQCLRKLGLIPAGGNYSTLNREISKHRISTDHFTGQGYLKGKTHNWSRRKYTWEEILVKDSPYKCNSTLKRRLVRDEIFENRCNSCKRTEWLGGLIPLELEHKNGDTRDNRIENLEFICPNCHTLTPTYRGKNMGKYGTYKRPPKQICIDCGKTLTQKRKTGRCFTCYHKNPLKKKARIIHLSKDVSQQRTVFCSNCSKVITGRSKSGICLSCSQRKRFGNLDRPNIEQLEQDVTELGYCGTGRKYGVSDNAIRKWMKE